MRIYWSITYIFYSIIKWKSQWFMIWIIWGALQGQKITLLQASAMEVLISESKKWFYYRSKICNLPGHKKSDLSVKLPFVVVFQTMEIQRLS